MPPLLQLRDIRLTLGGAPLLDGAELSISPGDRIALVGRNGSGKSTLLRIAAGDSRRTTATRFAQPNARLRYLPQEPDLSGFATTLDFVLPASATRTAPYRARALMDDLGVDPSRRSRDSSPAARRAGRRSRGCSPPSRTFCCSTSRPTISTWSRSNGWRTNSRRSRAAFALISHDKRLLADLTARDGLARSRRDAPARPGLRGLRGLARPEARRRGDRAPQARSQDRRRRALDALRRHRAAQAQHAPRRGTRRAAPRAARSAARRRASRRWSRRRRRPPARW